MAPHKKVFVIIIFLVFNVLSIASLTAKEMEKAGEMMKMVCIQKFKISEDVAVGIKDGKIPDDKTTKCYINCVFEMMQTMKKGKFLYESSIKQVHAMMPEEYKENTLKAIDICKNTANGIKDNCDAAFALIKCLHANNPQFVFA